MGLFNRKPRGMTPAEEAARRRGLHIPDDDRANADQQRADARAAAAPRAAFETKTLKFSQIDLVHGHVNLEKKLAPYIAEGWEVVSKDVKRYNAGGKHTVLLRRARA